MSVNPIPTGYPQVIPYLVTDDANKLAAFIQSTFNADLTECVNDKDEKIKHAELKIGNSMIMIGANGEAPNTNTLLYIYVENVDAAYERALKAGATSRMEPADQFYGDRSCCVEGPCGNQWCIASHIEDLSQEELQRRSQEFHASQS